MKKIFVLLCSITILQSLQAQSTLLDSARNELYRINKVFDSSLYLGFNVLISYKADSATTTLSQEQGTGSFVLNHKNLYYSMAGTEFVQTDSFTYSIYPDENMMIMSKNMIPENSDALPLRNFLDSVMNYFGNLYTITIDTVRIDSGMYAKTINFTSAVSSAYDVQPPYKTVSIEYDNVSYYPSKYSFSYREGIPVDSAGSNLITKTVVMNFIDYKSFGNAQVFKDEQYINYNMQRQIYEPVGKYKSYRFIASGFENEDPDAHYYKETPYKKN